MNALPPSSEQTDAPSEMDAAGPPPGCPAHGTAGLDGLVNLFGAEYTADAAGVSEQLRAEHGAVAPVVLEGGLSAWLVLGYRENLEVARTPLRFSRDSRNWRDLKEGNVPQDSPLLPLVAWQPICCFVDGEEHRRLRSAVTGSLERVEKRGIRRDVTRFANRLIDEFAPKGEADLVGQFAEQLPMLVLTRLIGLGDQDSPRLVEAVRDLAKGSPTAYASNEYVVEALGKHVAARRAAPGYDLTTRLMEHPAQLTDKEVVEHLRLILVAASENTTILISNAMRMVLSDPGFRASLAGARMSLSDAVERLLWDEPPTMVSPARWATSDMELAGQSIKAGDMLLLGLAAGNRDPEVRPERPSALYGNRSHLAFSHGPHECPGQDIGRAIAETAVETILARLPDLELAVEEKDLHGVSSWLNKQLVELPVTFEPQRRRPARQEDEEEPAPAAGSTGSAPAPAATPEAPAGDGAQPPEPAAAPQAQGRTPWWRLLFGRRGRR